jgi:hypothetical protein
VQPARGAARCGAKLVRAGTHPLTEGREIERLGEATLGALQERRATVEIVDRYHRLGPVEDLPKLVRESMRFRKLGIGAASGRDIARDAPERLGAIEAKLGGTGGRDGYRSISRTAESVASRRSASGASSERPASPRSECIDSETRPRRSSDGVPATVSA